MKKKTALTHNQTVVIEALGASERPLTAYEILDLKDVRAKGLKAPLTIYRALEKLVDRGLVHRIESLNAYIACAHRHPHRSVSGFMICNDCKKTVEYPLQECESHLLQAPQAAGFKIGSVRVEMVGQCAACTEKKNED
ncbi:MAG: Fur family transcriptional regulator [Pseudomonadota bacterium]